MFSFLRTSFLSVHFQSKTHLKVKKSGMKVTLRLQVMGRIYFQNLIFKAVINDSKKFQKISKNRIFSQILYRDDYEWQLDCE